jgi:hypothetical protein
MTTLYKNIVTEENVMKSIKILLAVVIIAMGSYGYHRFFASADSTEPIWLVVVLFIVIEAAILAMTTINFSSALKQAKSIGVGLIAAISVMWLISGVGIDQTIWGMVESKYHNVKLSESSVMADKETESLLTARITSLENEQKSYKDDIIRLENGKIKAQKAYDKTVRKHKDTVWYDGKNCDLSADCTSRKIVAENAVSLAKQNLEDYILNIKMVRENIILNNQRITKFKNNIEAIVNKRVEFESNSRVALDNKKEEGIIHVKLMNFMNNILGLQIETPERAYVMLLSFIIYPIYILFIAFMSSNSPEMRKLRQKELAQRAKKELAKKSRKNKNTVYKALMVLASYLRKIIGYLISTRTRKVITKTVEVEIEKEVEKEVEVIVYKDGKEIVEVEIEVPHIIEKEIVIEKIVKVPVVEKEFVTVPADINLNELNKLTGHGTVPKDLKDILRKINDGMEELKIRGVNNDKYRSA